VSAPTSYYPLIPTEIDAEMTSAVRVFMNALIAGFQSQISILQSQIVELYVKFRTLMPSQKAAPSEFLGTGM
jgi:hypothetical protein